MRIAVGLGSSLGDRRATLELALRQLAAHPDLTLVRASRWHRTPPMRGSIAKGWFLNGVAVFESRMSPPEVLSTCKRLEDAAGRRRVHWGDRPLDLDLLVVEDTVTETPELTLPHRAIAERPFVLYPLLEAWPGVRDPRSGLPYAACPAPPGPRTALAGVAGSRPDSVDHYPPPPVMP